MYSKQSYVLMFSLSLQTLGKHSTEYMQEETVCMIFLYNTKQYSTSLLRKKTENDYKENSTKCYSTIISICIQRKVAIYVL